MPFRYVYLHGLVRDEQGRKMSKSLGNALDPLDLIRDYGADALRYSLLTGGTPGNDIKLAISRVEAGRNFANKIWNAARFTILKLQEGETRVDSSDPNNPTYVLPDPALLSLPDRWILSRLESVSAEATRLIDDWQMGEAGRQLYEFFWNELADWYIEAAKVRLSEGYAGGGAGHTPGAGPRVGAQPPPAPPVHPLRHRGRVAEPARHGE